MFTGETKAESIDYDFILKLSHNGGYCPCKVDKTQETKCPCKDFRVNGICECGVYINR